MAIRSDGGNLFTVFAGGGDSVVEAFQIHVGSGGGGSSGKYEVSKVDDVVQQLLIDASPKLVK